MHDALTEAEVISVLMAGTQMDKLMPTYKENWVLK